jgi:hypothetical protein
MRPGETTAAVVSGPHIRQGKINNATLGMSEGRGPYWVPPKKGRRPAELVKAPYGVWKRKAAGKVVFDFALQVLPEGTSPMPIDEVVGVIEGVHI